MCDVVVVFASGELSEEEDSPFGCGEVAAGCTRHEFRNVYTVCRLTPLCWLYIRLWLYIPLERTWRRGENEETGSNVCCLPRGKARRRSWCCAVDTPAFKPYTAPARATKRWLNKFYIAHKRLHVAIIPHWISQLKVASEIFSLALLLIVKVKLHSA